MHYYKHVKHNVKCTYLDQNYFLICSRNKKFKLNNRNEHCILLVTRKNMQYISVDLAHSEKKTFVTVSIKHANMFQQVKDTEDCSTKTNCFNKMFNCI